MRDKYASSQVDVCCTFVVSQDENEFEVVGETGRPD